MIQQALDFIDEQIVGGSYIFEPGTSTTGSCEESKTYVYTIQKSIDGGDTYSDVLFYGNKFIEAGATRITLNITDFVRFNVTIPTYSELLAMDPLLMTATGVISIIKWDVYDGDVSAENRIAGNYTSVASIYRYPNRKESLDMMVGDPFVTQPTTGSFASMLQGCEYNNLGSGVIPYVNGYKLIPHFPVYTHSNGDIGANLYFCVQATGTENNVFSLEGTTEGGASSFSETIDSSVLTDEPSSVYFRYDYTYNSSTPAKYVDIVEPSSAIAHTVAEIDCSPCSRYYLMWQDRFGGYQSQPFCKGSTFSESFEKTEVKDYTNKRKPVQVDIQPKWEINTGWIDEDLYPIYESILVSKILVLTDVEEGVEYEVIVTDTNYTEKTFKNQGRKLFNLKLNLELATKQSITY